MKTITKITLIMLSFILMSSTCSTTKQVSSSKSPVLLVVGLDQSQTMDGFPVFSSVQMKSICESLIERNTDVCVSVGFIGNPTDEGFRRLLLKKIPEIDTQATMSVRGKQRKEAERIKSDNAKLIQQFISDLTLERNHVVKTCLNRFCENAARLVSEPQFKVYTKLVCLYSDGLEDSNGDNTVEPLSIHFPSNAKIYTVGWKNNEIIANSSSFADLQGFVQFINTINN